MASIVDFVEGVVRETTCRFFDNTNRAAQYIAGATSSIPGVGSATNLLSGGTAAIAGMACPSGQGDGSAGGAGAGDQFDGLPSGPPGACVGVAYTISGTANVLNAGGAVIRQLGYLTQRTGPLPEFILQVTSNNILVVDENGTTLANLGNRPPGTAGAEWENGYPTITRDDGLPPEACDAGTPGDPRPRSTQPITYEVGDGPSMTEDVDLIFEAPIVDVDNNLIIPVLINGPNIQFVANFNVNLGIVVPTFGLPDSGGDICCPPPDLPDLPEIPEVDDPPPFNQELRIIGAFVVATEILDTAPPTKIKAGDSVTTFVNYLGLINFAVAYQGGSGWTRDIEVKNAKQYIPVPGDLAAYTFRVFEQPGVTLEVTPLFARNQRPDYD